MVAAEAAAAFEVHVVDDHSEHTRAGLKQAPQGVAYGAVAAPLGPADEDDRVAEGAERQGVADEPEGRRVDHHMLVVFARPREKLAQGIGAHDRRGADLRAGARHDEFQVVIPRGNRQGVERHRRLGGQGIHQAA